MRALLLAKACGNCAAILACTADRMSMYEKQAAKHPNARILYAMEQLMRVQSDMRYFSSPRMLLETVLVRIAQPVDDESMEALSARLALVEEKLKNGVPAEPAPASAVSPVQEEDYLPEPPPEDGYLPAEAYEEPAAPVPVPAEAPRLKAEVPARPAVPAPAAPKAEAGGAAEADILWKQVLNRVEAVNRFTSSLAAFGRATSLSEDQLTVSFPAAYAGKLKMLNSRSVAIIQGELDKIRPGIHLALIEGDGDSDVADLIGLFKDKLTIT